MEQLRASRRRMAPRRGAGPVARPHHPRAALALQRQAGNRAVAALLTGSGPPALQRKAGDAKAPPRLGRGWERMGNDYSVADIPDALRSAVPPYPKGADIRAALAERPRLLEILTATELAQWQATVDRATAQREQNKLIRALERQSPLVSAMDEYTSWKRRADAALPPPGPPGGKLLLPLERFLDPAILQVAFDVQAETEFRRWAIARMAASPIEVTLIDPGTTDMRFASQLLPYDGLVTAESLQTLYRDEYRTRVTERPAMVQLRELVTELFGVHYELDPDFQNRLAMNKKYSGGLAFVRYWSEWLGEGSTDMPDVASWNYPFHQLLKPGAQLLREGKVEMAVPLIVSAELHMADVANRFLKYEHRVTSGAGVAIKWLERVKVAGSVAAIIASGPLGLSRAAFITGAYAGTQSVAQQASEVALGQRGSIDFGAAAKEAAVSAALTMIGMPLQARFQARILQSVVGREALEAGISATVLEQRVASALAGATSSVYTVPLQVVMGRVVQGKAMPNSVEELCDLILDEALKSAAMSPVTDRLSADVAKLKAERAGQAKEAGTRLEPDRRRTEELGSKLLALGEQAAAAKGAPAGPDGPSSTPDSASTATKDPAHTPDPTTEVGLTSPDAMKRVAGQIHELATGPAASRHGLDLAIKDRALRIIDVVAGELPAGMPPPKVVTTRLGNPHTFGTYSKRDHTIRINLDAKVTSGGAPEPAFAPTGPGFERLLGLIYHEARHAEQTFHALRVRAGTSPDLSPLLVGKAMSGDLKVHLDLALAAADRPLAPTDASPEAKLGRDIWAETFEKGTRKDLRDWAQKGVGERRQVLEEIDRLQIVLTDLHAQGKGKSPEWWQVWQYAHDIDAQLSRASQTYWHLAEEIDARRAGGNMEAIFRQVLAAQLELNAARQGLARAEKALATLAADKLDATTQALVMALKHQRRIEQSLAALAALLPKAPATGT